MLLAQHGLAEDGRGKGNVCPLDEPQRFVVHGKAMHFHIREDDRTLRRIQHRHRFAHGLGERERIARLVNLPRAMVRQPRCRHEIARQFEIHGPLVTHRRVQHAVDLGERRVGIVEHGRGNGDLIEHPPLRVELAHLVMQQRILLPLAHPRRAADDDHR